MTTTLGPEVRAAIDAHLEAIEQVLARAGTAREQRRTIADNVETQIRDMLAARCADRPATAADIAAVLTEVDPPAAYGPDAGKVNVPPVRRPARAGGWPTFAVLYLWQLVTVTILAVPTLFLLCVFVPHYRRIYVDFKAALPFATELLIGCSNLMVHHGWVLLLPALAILPLPASLLFAWVDDRRRSRALLVVELLWVLGAVGLWVTIFLTMWLPLRSLIQSMSEQIR